MSGSEVWEAGASRRTYSCVQTGMEGTRPIAGHQLEDYSNSQDEKLRRPEKARNEGSREKEGRRLEVGRADV